jgi:hypothetical protein
MPVTLAIRGHQTTGDSPLAGARRTRFALMPMAFCLLSLVSTGCAHFWDDLSARSPEGGFRNDMAYRWHLLTHKEEPLVTLRDNRDGDMRARAYRQLEEPKLHGGSDEDQKVILKILEKAATTGSPVCRVAAIETLGRFKDPAAVDILKDAFLAPINFGDKNPVVRMAALRSLGSTGDPKASQVLVQAMLYDPTLDVRVAAAEGLGDFQSAEVTTALLKVLRDQKDQKELALRNQASQSLAKITGKKDMPADAEKWDGYFRQLAANGNVPPKEPRSWLRPVSWFKDSE